MSKSDDQLLKDLSEFRNDICAAIIGYPGTYVLTTNEAVDKIEKLKEKASLVDSLRESAIIIIDKGSSVRKKAERFGLKINTG